jgi:hypothetical protein
MYCYISLKPENLESGSPAWRIVGYTRSADTALSLILTVFKFFGAPGTSAHLPPFF